MSGMVAGWIVSVASMLLCGCIALVLARVVKWLDSASVLPEAVEPDAAAHGARPVVSGGMTARVASGDAVENPVRDQAQRRASLEREREDRGTTDAESGHYR